MTESVWKIKANQRDRRRFTVLDDAAPPAPVDVTNWTIDAVLKSRPGGNTVHTFPIGDVSIVSGPLGQVEVRIPAAVSAAFAFGHAWYRVRVIPPSAATDAQRVLEGPLIVSPD